MEKVPKLEMCSSKTAIYEFLKASLIMVLSSVKYPSSLLNSMAVYDTSKGSVALVMANVMMVIY